MEREQREQQIVAGIYEEMQRRFTAYNDLAHGWEHVERVYTLALHIAEEERANTLIVAAAALMHDGGRLLTDETGHHADRSVMLANEVMNAYAIAPDVREAILHAIVAHSFSRGVEPETVEARVVRDADRLDGLGALGIIRWAITGAVRQGPATRTYHASDPFATQHALDDTHYMLDHFFTKLLKLKETMSTETGRRLAEQRTAFMHTFLDELRIELALQ